jgi:hypothetical protein
MMNDDEYAIGPQELLQAQIYGHAIQLTLQHTMSPFEASGSALRLAAMLHHDDASQDFIDKLFTNRKSVGEKFKARDDAVKLKREQSKAGPAR